MMKHFRLKSAVKAHLGLTLFVSSCSIIGCAGLGMGYATRYQKEMSDETDLWGGYVKNADYETQIDLFIGTESPFGFARLVLIPPKQKPLLGLAHYSAPESVELYKRNLNNWTNLRGILFTGSLIRPRSLKKEGAMAWGAGLSIYGEVLDGEFAGTVVDISDLSSYVGKEIDGLILLKPDPRLLKKVEGIQD